MKKKPETAVPIQLEAASNGDAPESLLSTPPISWNSTGLLCWWHPSVSLQTFQNQITGCTAWLIEPISVLALPSAHYSITYLIAGFSNQPKVSPMKMRRPVAQPPGWSYHAGILHPISTEWIAAGVSWTVQNRTQMITLLSAWQRRIHDATWLHSHFTYCFNQRFHIETLPMRRLAGTTTIKRRLSFEFVTVAAC